MLTGKLMGHGIATNQRGDQVPYQLIEPARTRDNITEIAREMKRWSRIANILRGYQPAFMGMDPIATRASFGEDVIALTGEDVRLGQCCVLMAQAQDGRILGVVEYVVRPDQAGIELLAVDPANLPGVSPDKGLRGIGTGIVAAISRRVLAEGSPRVTLVPFDPDAKRFWRHRGFKDCNPPVMCVDGSQEIANLIGSCDVAQDCPDQDECVVCGVEARAMMYRPPETRAYTEEQITQMNATSRGAGAIGARALVPRYIAETARPGETILDFGAGRAAQHTQMLRGLGLNVTPSEIGANVVPGLHDPHALERDYDTVMLSNVVNVQPSRREVFGLVALVSDLVTPNGRVVLNYPQEPRRSSVTPADLIKALQDRFRDVRVVGGSPSAPVIEAKGRYRDVRPWTTAQDAQMRLSKVLDARDRYKLAYIRLPMAERMRRMGQYQGGLQPLQAAVDAAREEVRRA